MPVSPCSARTMVPPGHLRHARELRLALAWRARVVSGLPSSSRRTPLILPSGADVGDDLGRAPTDLDDVDARPLALRSSARRSTGSPSRSSPSVTRTMTRTWSFDFGSRAKTSRPRSRAPRRRRAADGHVVGIELAEELRDRRAVARQREAHRLAREGHRAEARAGQVLDEARRPRPSRARCGSARCRARTCSSSSRAR